MYKYIILFLFFAPMSLFAQTAEILTFQKVDSLTYNAYMSGKWDKIITVGEQALQQKVDYKRLRQRMGYAYYLKGNYFAAQTQYNKAYEFDSSDADTRNYLYFCALETGNEAIARFHASNLPKETKEYYNLKPFRPIDAIDMEYNYKTTDVSIRSNPIYKRAGLNSYLGYKLSLYQSIANYSQLVNNNTQTKQIEYYALATLQATSHTAIRLAYHYIETDVNSKIFPGKLFFGALSHQAGRFNIGLQASSLSNEMGKYKQYSALMGVVLPGKANFYLNTTLSQLLETNNNRTVFAQIAGLRLFKPLWLEGQITFGNIKNYNDCNALYVYNSLDATVFQCGGELSYYLGKHLKLFFNYTYDKKELKDFKSTNYYNQYSFLGGFRWKL